MERLVNILILSNIDVFKKGGKEKQTTFNNMQLLLMNLEAD